MTPPEGVGTPPALLIPADVLNAMVDHCRREAPRECCGLLAGVAPRASAIYPLRNAAEDPGTRYNANPQDLIDAVRDYRAAGSEMLAIYHSHPRWPAVPSRADLALNFYGPLPRIIVSLLEAEPIVRAWRLGADAFEELPWRVAPVEPGGAGG